MGVWVSAVKWACTHDPSTGFQPRLRLSPSLGNTGPGPGGYTVLMKTQFPQLGSRGHRALWDPGRWAVDTHPGQEAGGDGPRAGARPSAEHAWEPTGLGDRAQAGVQIAASAAGELRWAGKPQVGGPGHLPNLSEGRGPQSVVSPEAPRLCRACQSQSDRQTDDSVRNCGLLALAVVHVGALTLPDTWGPADSGHVGRWLSRGGDSKPGNRVEKSLWS